MLDLRVSDGAGVTGDPVQTSAPPVGPPALGPGDDDPRSPASGAAVGAGAPLGPGDDDPRSPAVGPHVLATPALGPGDAAGVNPDDAFHFLAPPAPGPGDPAGGPRSVVRIPKAKAVIAAEKGES